MQSDCWQSVSLVLSASLALGRLHCHLHQGGIILCDISQQGEVIGSMMADAGDSLVELLFFDTFSHENTEVWFRVISYLMMRVILYK